MKNELKKFTMNGTLGICILVIISFVAVLYKITSMVYGGMDVGQLYSMVVIILAATIVMSVTITVLGKLVNVILQDVFKSESDTETDIKKFTMNGTLGICILVISSFMFALNKITTMVYVGMDVEQLYATITLILADAIIMSVTITVLGKLVSTILKDVFKIKSV
jgi:hypothetical protein